MARDPHLLAECRALQRAVTAHPTLAGLEADAAYPALCARMDALFGAVHRHAPAAAPPAAPREPGHVRVVQWNLEHGNRWERIAPALGAHAELADADLLLLEEVDLGCARSGNRDLAAELAAALGRHAAWAPLFLETTPGRHDDAAHAGGRANEEGLSGLAVLARWPLGEARVVPLPSPTRWQFERERMAGAHGALVAEVLRPGAPFVAAVTHLEVHRTRAHRAAQVRVLAAALAGEPRPVVLAGDFNSHTFDRGRRDAALQGAATLLLTPGPLLRARFLAPDRGPWREPLFAELARAGFTWAPFNDGAPTLRLRGDRLEELNVLPAPVRGLAARALAWAVGRGALRLDWVCGRGWAGGRGRTVVGLEGPGGASDHAPIVADLTG